MVISDAPAFSFGEAKENAGAQSQICRKLSAFQQFFNAILPR
ncbi:MAG: hypothetical protein PUK39_07370 [Clostridiales bacterium]|nr:hypothetical protein [Clostridiales bacterium]